MVDEASEPVVKVSRYNLARLRLAQLLIPAALISRIAAKYLPGPLTFGIGVALFVATGVVILTVRKGFGVHQLRSSKGHLQFGPNNQISATEAVSWHMSNSTAVIRTRVASWRFHAQPEGAQLLRAKVQRALGEPLELRRAGTPRARLAAFLVTLVCACALALGIYFNSFPMLAVGVLGVMFAGPTLVVLSLKISAKGQQEVDH